MTFWQHFAISFAILIVLGAGLIIAARKKWRRTSKVLEAVLWLWPF